MVSGRSSLRRQDPVLENVIPTTPYSLPAPERLVLVSPHPDDVGISAGALAAVAARGGVPATIVLATDGSEARLPASVLRRHGWNAAMSAVEQRALRGAIRVAEARTEAARLGLGESAVVLLKNQRWFTAHRTPREYLHADLSLRSVDGFRPGPLDEGAVAELRDLLPRRPGGLVVCAAPDPLDKLLMHRLVTALLVRALRSLRATDRAAYALVTYECLSTAEWSAPITTYLGFERDVMRAKRHAIRAHRSMYERRKRFGGYSNPGRADYDAVVVRANADLAARAGLPFPFAERYGLYEDLSPAVLDRVFKLTAVPLP